MTPPRVTIIGAGIGGLVLALELHAAGIPCRIYERASELRPLGVGINILPHATDVLAELDVLDRLERIGIQTREAVFYNRFGQRVYAELTGRYAGYDYPQLSIHRGELQLELARIVTERLGEDAITLNYECQGVHQHNHQVTAVFRDPSTGASLGTVTSEVVVGCDGVHSAIRRQFHPSETTPQYSGVLMWRGTAVAPPFLSGASMVRAGWLDTGKLVIYPIRDDVDAEGNQLINWVAELEHPYDGDRDWSRRGELTDFLPAFADWHFDWLDVPQLLASSDTILEYPMVDQDPLERWTFGRTTLLGDAAHPMVPRGSNGAGQAILDARRLRTSLAEHHDPRDALADYEDERRPQTTAVVLTNRVAPPDAILREVWQRTGDRPFDGIEEVIDESELAAISQRYKDITGLQLPEPPKRAQE